MNDIFSVIGLRIAKKRKELNYSQEALAERAGMHRNYIGYIERAEKRVTITGLLRITMALDMTLEELFRGY